MRVTSRAGLTAAAVGLSVLMLSSTASAASAPGSDSVGDSYYPHDGNGGYNVSHYDINVAYQPKSDELSGQTVITAKATQDLSRFNLDFLLTASSVKVNGVKASFKKAAGGELVVTPKTALPKGKKFNVIVSYDDTPHKYKLYDYEAWKQTKSGASAVDEPQIAPWWFPSNDHPTDKATYDVSVAAPKGKSVLSNGILEDKSTVDGGLTRWHWRNDSPTATYLTFFTLGDFTIPQGQSPIGKNYVTGYAKELKYPDAAKASIEKTPEVLKYEEQFFGKYPFGEQGGVVTTGLGFALENQTRPVYDDVFFDQGPDTYVVAHENAHEWYGDSVSVNRWKDVWLNEGFATYAEFLWSEHEGDGTPADVAQAIYDQHPADDKVWKVKPADPGVDNIWGWSSYDRGGLTLQALRTKVGDAAFFKILKTWQQKKAGGDGTTEQFIALAEKISGKPLQKLFDTWLYTAAKPKVGPNGSASSATATTARAANAKAAPKSLAQIERTTKLLAASDRKRG